MSYAREDARTKLAVESKSIPTYLLIEIQGLHVLPGAPTWPYFTHSFIFGFLVSSTNAENGRVLPQGVAARWGDWVVAALGSLPGMPGNNLLTLLPKASQP